MTGRFLLDWAVMAVSFFNTILLLWLGMTVWLNADCRSAGVVITAMGFVLGSSFFFSHSAILGLGQMPYRADLWWQLGWVPVILAPSAWYVVMLVGLGNVYGAIVGGFLVALLQTATQQFIGIAWEDVIPTIVMIIILILVPSGIFGSEVKGVQEQ